MLSISHWGCFHADNWWGSAEDDTFYAHFVDGEWWWSTTPL
jgi:hypothetical protein